VSQSVASVSPGVLLHAVGPWTPPETRFGPAVCSQGKRAALVTGVRPQPGCLATGEAKYRGADKSLVRPGRKQTAAKENFEFSIFYL